MDFKEVLSYWKAILVFVVFIASTVVGLLAYAEDQQVVMQAQAALMTNEVYQEGRIGRKQIEVNENQRELENLLQSIGDDEPTLRESRELNYLDDEIARLREEIEDIRVELAQK
jgi:hypothetical protein